MQKLQSRKRATRPRLSPAFLVHDITKSAFNHILLCGAIRYIQSVLDVNHKISYIRIYELVFFWYSLCLNFETLYRYLYSFNLKLLIIHCVISIDRLFRKEKHTTVKKRKMRHRYTNYACIHIYITSVFLYSTVTWWQYLYTKFNCCNLQFYHGLNPPVYLISSHIFNTEIFTGIEKNTIQNACLRVRLWYGIK